MCNSENRRESSELWKHWFLTLLLEKIGCIYLHLNKVRLIQFFSSFHSANFSYARALPWMLMYPLLCLVFGIWCCCQYVSCCDVMPFGIYTMKCQVLFLTIQWSSFVLYESINELWLFKSQGLVVSWDRKREWNFWHYAMVPGLILE